MGLILDTNALSAVADGEPRAVAEYTDADQIGVPVIVLGEFRFGIAQSRLRRGYEAWLANVLPATKIFHITEATAAYYAQLRLELKNAGTPVPANDTWIAALCRQHAFPILSRDRHFDRIKGLRRIAW